MEHNCANNKHHHKPTKRLVAALGLTVTFAFVQMYNGIIANATVLIADAWHMLADSASMLIALILPWLILKIWNNRVKSEAISALACSSLLLLPCWEIIERIIDKWHTDSTLDAARLTWVAIIGLLVNSVCLWLVHSKDNHEHLSMEGVKWHIVGDLLGSVAAITVGIVSLLSVQASAWANITGSAIILIILLFGLIRLAKVSLLSIFSTPEGQAT